MIRLFRVFIGPQLGVQRVLIDIALFLGKLLTKVFSTGQIDQLSGTNVLPAQATTLACLSMSAVGAS